MGVVGFDDNTHFSLLSPSASAIAQPIDEISRAIVKNIVSALAKEGVCEPRTNLLKSKLIKRQSSIHH